MSITAFIPYGQTNAISRADLSSALSLSDRKVRIIVSALRLNWKPIEPFICSDPHDKGYWLSCDSTEIRSFADHYSAYNKSIVKVLNNIERGLAEIDGTRVVWVSGHYRHISAGGQ